MISKIGLYNYSIDAYLCDFRGKATLSMLGNFMLQVATKHADERGFGFSSMIGKNRVWVLSRMTIEIIEYPEYDTELKLRTWVSDVNKLFTERCFSFEDSNGNIIGYARSVWASIDMETRRLTNVLELDGLLDFSTGEPCPIDPFKKILPVTDIDPDDKFTVKYSDIDINKHLNSMKYIEHFVDLFDIKLFNGKEIKRFEICYLNEAHYGASIDVFKKEEDNATCILEMRDGEKIVSASRVVWM